MRRIELEHVVAAAAQVSNEVEFVVVGSQAILATEPYPPEAMRRSIEADIYPRDAPDKAGMIDGALGDGSPSIGPMGTTPTASVPRRRRPRRAGSTAWL
jgi:hypothetical protein